jgi:hypothetical protein
MNDHDRAYQGKITRTEMPMFVLLARSTLLAGVLTAALSPSAWSADGDAAVPATVGTDPPAAMATTSPQATSAGAQATVQVGEAQPTRAHTTLPFGKRYAGPRVRIGYDRPVHTLMLGIGY